MKKHWRPHRDCDYAGYSNASRAVAAESAVRQACVVREGKLKDAAFDEDSVVDLLADIGHLCDREGIDFDKMISTAKMHWEAER